MSLEQYCLYQKDLFALQDKGQGESRAAKDVREQATLLWEKLNLQEKVEARAYVRELEREREKKPGIPAKDMARIMKNLQDASLGYGVPNNAIFAKDMKLVLDEMKRLEEENRTLKQTLAGIGGAETGVMP